MAVSAQDVAPSSWPASAPRSVELAGIYRGQGGGDLVIAPVNDTLVRYRDLGSGRIGVLVRSGERDRFVGDSAEVSFTRDAAGHVAAARWSIARSDGPRGGSGSRLPLRHEVITWQSGDAVLSGTLVLPGSGETRASIEPYCTVVVQPGASWITRYGSNALETGYTFAARGVAALVYDKRGWGASTGDQLVAFETTAGDLARAVDTLRTRFDIDPEAIGVWALSQGAWVAPLAGTMTDGIGFYVLVGAPGTTPARQETQRGTALLEAIGRPPEHVAAIRRFQETSFRYSVTGRGWNDYVEARAVGERQDWLNHVWSPSEPGPDNFLWGRLNGYFNPLPSLLTLDEPLLALWGEHDVNVLPAVHHSIFEVALDAAGNEAATLKIVPEADHVLLASRSRDPAATEARFAPGILGQITGWVEEVCGHPRPASG